jgi:hypothetical protein
MAGTCISSALSADERKRSSLKLRTPRGQRAGVEHPPRKPGLYGWYKPGLYFSFFRRRIPRINRLLCASLAFLHVMHCFDGFSSLT